MPQIQIGAIWCTQINCGYTPPVDPRFRGCQITTMDRNTGFVYDERRIPGQSGGPEVRGVGAIFPTPSMVKEVDVWFQSYSDLGVNPIVPGVTPWNTVTVGKTGGVLDLAMATPATLNTAAFASTIKPVEIVATLPASFTNYPQGAVVFLTSDNKLYRSTGTAWTKVLDPTDIPDRTLAASKMIALSITSNELAADSATFGKVAAAAIGTRELVTGELLIGLGGGKPSKLKFVDAFGAATAFLGADIYGHWNWFQDICVGPDINNPNFYCDGTGAWLQNIPFTLTLNNSRIEATAAIDDFTGTHGSFRVTDAVDQTKRIALCPYGMSIASGAGIYAKQLGMLMSQVSYQYGILWLGTTANNSTVYLQPEWSSPARLELYGDVYNPQIVLNAIPVLTTPKTGWALATGTATRSSFATSTVTLPRLAEAVKAIIDDLMGWHRLFDF